MRRKNKEKMRRKNEKKEGSPRTKMRRKGLLMRRDSRTHLLK
jgi:hypothetical protein